MNEATDVVNKQIAMIWHWHGVKFIWRGMWGGNHLIRCASTIYEDCHLWFDDHYNTVKLWSFPAYKKDMWDNLYFHYPIPPYRFDLAN